MLDPIALFISDVRASPRGKITEISRSSGVKVKTLRNILYRVSRNPSSDVYRKLGQYYESRNIPL